MAQVVKLKRTSVQGRIPSISNLELGELAINTHDGRIFFEKDDGTLSIQEILTTNSQNSGSFNLTGAISASSLEISGNANITGNLVLGGHITIGDASSDTIAFAGDISSSLIPDVTNAFDLGSTTRKFANVYATNLYGSINSTNGVVSGSSQIDVLQTTNFSAFSSSVASTFSGLSTDYNDLQNIPSGIISSSAQIDDLFDIDGLVSSSTQVISLLPSGTISGSSQVDVTTTTNYSNIFSSPTFTGTTTVDSISFGDATIATSSGTIGITATSGISLLTSGGGDGVIISANGNTTIYGALALQDIATDATSTTALVANGSNVISKRTLGSNAFTSDVYALDSALTTEKNRIDAILLSADADKDSFAEIVTLINSVDTTNDEAFASFYTSSNDRFDSIESFTSSIDTIIKTKLDSDGVISGSSQVVSSLSNQDIDLGTGDITATVGSFDVIDLDRLAVTSTQTTVSPLHLTATNLNDGVGALRIDGKQADIYLNPSTPTHTTVTFAVAGSPKLAFGMDSSNDFYITRKDDTTWYDDTFVLDRNTGEITLGYDLTVNGNINATNGIISGSSQLTSSFDSRYLNVSGEGNISGSFTGSFIGSFSGDGSGLTGLSVDVGETTTVTSSFENQSTISVIHSFDSRNVLVSVYDTTYSQIIPQSITLTDNNTVDIILSNTGSGHVVLAKGGHIVSGSYTVLETATVDDTFTNETLYVVNHTFETKNVFVSVYDNDDEQIIPALVSTPTTSSVQIGFDNPTSGRVVIGKAGHIVSSSFDTYRLDVSGNSSYAVSHSLDEEYPFVQAWNTDTKKQEQPLDVESTSPSSLTVTFSGNFAGKIIVKK